MSERDKISEPGKEIESVANATGVIVTTQDDKILSVEDDVNARQSVNENANRPSTETNDNVTADQNLSRKSDRKVTLTSKGIVYSLQKTTSFMKSCHRRLMKQVDILLLLLKGNHTDSVTNDLNIVEKTYSEFADLYARVVLAQY